MGLFLIVEEELHHMDSFCEAATRQGRKFSEGNLMQSLGDIQVAYAGWPGAYTVPTSRTFSTWAICANATFWEGNSDKS